MAERIEDDISKSSIGAAAYKVSESEQLTSGTLFVRKPIPKFQKVSSPLWEHVGVEVSSSSSDEILSIKFRGDDGVSSKNVKRSNPSSKVQKAPKKKRKYLFPPIKPCERCNKCENCLNPQRKQACVVARQRQIDQLEAEHKESKEAKSPDDPFINALRRLLSNEGRVPMSKVGELMYHIERAENHSHKYALLNVIMRSKPEVAAALMKESCLPVLESWLSTFLDKTKLKAISRTLDVLNMLPITVSALRTCSIAKLVSNIRNCVDVGEGIKVQARKLRKKWMDIVQGSANTDRGAINSKPLKSTQTAHAAIIPPPPKTIEQQHSGQLLSAVEDGDLFKSADKQRLAPSQPAKKPAEVAKAPVPVSKAASSPFMALNFSPPIAGSSVTMLGADSFSLQGMTTLPRVVAETASSRAAAAAARIPSPEPIVRKEKRKKVSWVIEDNLETVRWFLQGDPAVAVQQDADAAAIQEEISSQPSSWANAAKREHLSEATALAKHREEEDREKTLMKARLSVMQAAAPWYDPPVIESMYPSVAALAYEDDGSFRRAWGEESAEAVARRSLAHLVPTQAGCAFAPAEPDRIEDCGVNQDWRRIPHIPLETAHAAAVSQAVAEQPPAVDVSKLLAQLAASGALAPSAETSPPDKRQPVPQQSRASIGTKNSKQCKFHGQPGGCKWGNSCKFAHEGPPGPAITPSAARQNNGFKRMAGLHPPK